MSESRDNIEANNALWRAIDWNDIQAARQAIKAGAALNATGSNEWTVLHKAVAHSQNLSALEGRTRMVQLLIKGGADVQAQDGRGRTALHAALSVRMDDVAYVLIVAGSNVNAVNGDGESVMHYAACYGQVPIVNDLINAGVTPNALDKEGRTALHEAIASDRFDVAEVLFKAGWDPTIQDNDGRTPLAHIPIHSKYDWTFLREAVVERERQALTASLESTYNLPPQQRSQSSRQRL